MTMTERTTRKEVKDTAMGITLAEYKRADAELRIEEGRIGFIAHAIIYALMNALLIVINLAFVPENTWFFYPLIAWGIGLLMHYLYEIRFVRRTIEEREAKVEYRARQILSGEASLA